MPDQSKDPQAPAKTFRQQLSQKLGDRILRSAANAPPDEILKLLEAFERAGKL